VRESLEDEGVLGRITVLSEREDEDWHILSVEISPADVGALSSAIKPGWYMHFWSAEDMIIIFKDKIFNARLGDEQSFLSAIEYGKSVGIAPEQLDFVVELE